MNYLKREDRFVVLLCTAAIAVALVCLCVQDTMAQGAEAEPAIVEEVAELPEESEIIEQTLFDLATPLGEGMVTAYCSCYECCDEWALNRPVDENGKEIVYTASGAVAVQGNTVAVDPDVIPLNSLVYIEMPDGEIRCFCAQDTGGAIDDNDIDLYFEDHNEALEWGVQYLNIWYTAPEISA